MAYNLQNVDLSRYTFNVGLIFNLVFFEDFNGYFLTSDQVGSEPNFSEGALAQGFAFNRKKISMLFISNQNGHSKS